MEHAAPLISIVIPTWNRVQPVVAAVESAGPLDPDMEVVIVDNASEPALFDELHRTLGSRPGIRLFRNEHNLGMVKNWNRCLELARGEWLGLLCSDDCYLPGALGRLRELLHSGLAPALIIQDPRADGDVTICPQGGATVRTLRLPIASGNFWHRLVYEQAGGFDERFEYSADAEYWYRAALSFPVIKVREPFAEYFAHEENYMWSTWRRSDYLQQTELLARTVAGYMYASDTDRDVLVERHVDDSVWKTLLSIVECSLAAQGKTDILESYLREAQRRAGSFPRKLCLIKTIVAATMRRVRSSRVSGGRICQ